MFTMLLLFFNHISRNTLWLQSPMELRFDKNLSSFCKKEKLLISCMLRDISVIILGGKKMK